jgi:hypothetical protein
MVHKTLTQVIGGRVYQGVWDPTINDYSWEVIGTAPGAASRAKAATRAKAGTRPKAAPRGSRKPPRRRK